MLKHILVGSVLLLAPLLASAADRDFAGIRFGVGVSLTLDTGSTDRIDDAQIIDGLVRVDKESNNRARVMLESHYFFLTKKQKDRGPIEGKWGFGPFVAIQPGTDEIIEAIGGGIMFGFKRQDEVSSSWNIGLGLVIDPNVQVLGDGFVENMPPPGTENQVRFKTKSQVGVLLIASFSF